MSFLIIISVEILISLGPHSPLVCPTAAGTSLPHAGLMPGCCSSTQTVRPLIITVHFLAVALCAPGAVHAFRRGEAELHNEWKLGTYGRVGW